eukprot:9466692-Pyramimonas_sp.AAC.1
MEGLGRHMHEVQEDEYRPPECDRKCKPLQPALDLQDRLRAWENGAAPRPGRANLVETLGTRKDTATEPMREEEQRMRTLVLLAGFK